MTHKHSLTKLSKFLTYILGHKPYEFGLVPDKDGYVKIKELLKAIHEEEGWRHIRKSAIDELMLTLPQPPIEIRENLIRAVSRERIPDALPIQNPPGLLYTCIRQKAYPQAVQKGLWPLGHSYIILSGDESFAERLGRRIDQKPVVLTIHVKKAIQHHVQFNQFGDLYTANFIPADTFTGPPLPKEKPELKTREAAEEHETDYHPGSFTVDFGRDKSSPKSSGHGKKRREPDWKRDRKKLKRQKEKRWQS